MGAAPNRENMRDWSWWAAWGFVAFIGGGLLLLLVFASDGGHYECREWRSSGHGQECVDEVRIP